MPAVRKKTVYIPEHDLDGVCGRVLERVRPNEAEIWRERKEIEKLLLRMRGLIPAEIGIELAGSMAKGTNLRGALEFDIFMLFPKHYTLKDLEVLGLEWAKTAVAPHKWHVGYAEHPYLNAKVGNADVDLVPSFKITSAEEMQSSVDRSQLHTHYILRSMNEKQKDEVRLLKQFMKASGTYGAELRVGGFSGYLCELLILHYGGFAQLLHAASAWKNPKIDVAGHYASKEMPAFFDAPFIVIDPVDQKRNVAAVVSQTSLSRFIFHARSFLKRPSGKFFFSQKQQHSASRMRKLIASRKTHVLALRFAAPQVVDDILWPQLKRASQCIVKSLSAQDFQPFGYYHWSDGKECVLLLELSHGQLSCVRRVSGPAIYFAQDCEKFLSAHKNALNLHLEHERLVAVEKRAQCTVEGALKAALKTPRKLGIPENFCPLVKKYRLLPTSALLSKKYLEFLGDYFTRKLS